MINPYEIMNMSPNSTLTELKKSYYQMALICHPDKGGTEEDMIVIHNAYKYIKEQLENCDNTNTYEELEDAFSSFCKEQEETPPPFRDIWEDSEQKKLRDEFNSAFEESNIDSNNELDSMPVDKNSFVESNYKDALDALIVLGYNKKDICNHIDIIVSTNKDVETSDLIKKVLNKIGK